MPLNSPWQAVDLRMEFVVPDRPRPQVSRWSRDTPRVQHAHDRRRAQWVDATLACSLAAGVLKPKVSLGR